MNMKIKEDEEIENEEIEDQGNEKRRKWKMKNEN